MRVYSLFFSPTGSTKAVADILAHTLGNEVTDIDLSVHNGDYSGYSFHSDDLCIISVPAFGGRVPPPALQALQQMQAHKAIAIAVVTYGNRHYDDALLELRNMLVKVGFHVIAGIAAVTEHSIMRQFGTGRPNDTDRQELVAFGNKISSSLKRGFMPPSADLPGKEPCREYGGVPLKPTAGRSCTGCGLCAQQCPVGAIATDNLRGVDKAVCISCMRCIAICPAKARKLNPLMLKAAGEGMARACSEPKKNLLFCRL